MKRQTMGLMLTGVLITSFGVGYAIACIYQNMNINHDQKPVMTVEEKNGIISEDISVIFEQEYSKCGHVIISEFENREDLLGKTIKEIKKIYRVENGYTISSQDNNLVIHQIIDDWCPAEKEKCRLKEYEGLLAVYKGPDAQNDNLMRVTVIRLNNLPENIQMDIKAGEYEFSNEQDLNDCLENLDEYL